MIKASLSFLITQRFVESIFVKQENVATVDLTIQTIRSHIYETVTSLAWDIMIITRKHRLRTTKEAGWSYHFHRLLVYFVELLVNTYWIDTLTHVLFHELLLSDAPVVFKIWSVVLSNYDKQDARDLSPGGYFKSPSARFSSSMLCDVAVNKWCRNIA